MFLKRFKIIFILIIVLSGILLAYNLYKQYSFKNNPLNTNILNKVNIKHKKLSKLAAKHFKIKDAFKVIVKKKLPSNLFGMATYSQEGEILIYLNKSRFKESDDYMLDSVFPHEYAHAVMFYFNKINEKNRGHSKQWQKVCQVLQGVNCFQFVKHDDIVFSKLKF